MPNPKEYETEEAFMAVCVPKMKGEGKEQEQAIAACLNMWKNRDKANEENFQSNFSFTELSGDLKAIDGLAVGKFTAMSGDEVEFKAEELQDYIDNTNAIIESTKTEGGEIVGLPIDKNTHDHAGGAGWIKGLELDKARNVIRFMVDWTKDGTDLIKENMRRFFSPSTNPESKTILGGSLTNWPATRNNKGQVLLRPIELSQQIKEIDMTKTLEDVLTEMEAIKTQNAELAAKIAELAAPKKPVDGEVTDEMKEFIARTEGAEELGQRAQEIAQRTIKDAERKKHVMEFAAKIVGGTPEHPYGVPVRSREIVAALLSMPDNQRKFMEGLIERMWNGVVDFAEHGYYGSELSQGKQVPAEYKPMILEWVKNGKTAASWFTDVMPELGDGRDFNLKEFAAPEKEA
jgi:hypothetical protein